MTKQNHKIRYILITGASRGIGFCITKHLSEYNYKVFAGVRNEEDFNTLKKLNNNVIPIYLDVTNEDSIISAKELIQNNCDNLYALINNAGISLIEPLEKVSIKDLKKQFEINSFAPIRIIQEFSSLITEGKIINISSIASDLELPFAAPYCASKKTLEIFTNMLKKESFNSNNKIITIKAGTINTNIWNKEATKFKDTPYFSVMQTVYKWMSKLSKNGQKPEKFAKYVFDILEKKHNIDCYYYGLDSFIINNFRFLINFIIKILIFILKRGELK